MRGKCFTSIGFWAQPKSNLAPGTATDASLEKLRNDVRQSGLYCSVLGVSVVNDIVFPLDADRSAFSYSCDSLPACDASDACSCFESTGPVLRPNIIISGSCSCSDDGGDITRTCAN